MVHPVFTHLAERAVFLGCLIHRACLALNKKNSCLASFPAGVVKDFQNSTPTSDQSHVGVISLSEAVMG
jgi:hypothetical protein